MIVFNVMDNKLVIKVARDEVQVETVKMTNKIYKIVVSQFFKRM